LKTPEPDFKLFGVESGDVVSQFSAIFAPFVAKIGAFLKKQTAFL
jgi:hypothetical protein